MKIKIPYGREEVTISIPEKNLLGVLHPKRSRTKRSESEIIREAVLNPMGCCPLKDLVSPKDKVAIVVPDLTRRCPRDLILPILLDELNRGGIRDKDITIFVAVGLHRPLTRLEIEHALGREVINRVKTKNHNATNRSNLMHLGYVSGGVPAVINKELLYNDHVIAIGVIEPHLYAGFSGGPKTLSMGMAGEETIGYTHSPKFLDRPGVKLGVIKDNPFHRAIIDIACISKLKFIVNVINDDLGRTIFATSGEPQLAFYKGIEDAILYYRVKVEEPADIVICAIGWPKDANIYQASRALTYITNTQRPIVKKGGLVIISAQCKEGFGRGLGEKRFYRALISEKEPADLVKKMKGGECLGGEQRAYMVARSLTYVDCALAGAKFPEIVKKMHMLHFENLGDALDYAFKTRGKSAKAYVIPHALVTLPVSK